MAAGEGVDWGLEEDKGATMGFEGEVSSPLGFAASMSVEAALVQDEAADADRRAANEEAAMRHVGRDPRDELL
jgi:hypothetical protein